MNIYNIPLYLPVSEALNSLIINKNNDNNLPYLIITPNKKAKEYCLNYFNNNKNYRDINLNISSISEPKDILANLLKICSPSLKKDFLNLLNTNIININVRNFLLSKLVKAADSSISLQQSINICDELAVLLDTLDSENISLDNLDKLNINSNIFSENIFNLLKVLKPHWNKILKESQLENILGYKAKVYNFISNNIKNNNINCKIIIFSIDTYSKYTIQLLKSISDYSHGTVLFNGIDYFISEENWNKLSCSHPQYIHKQILKKLHLTRNDIKCCSTILTNEFNNKLDINIDIFPRIFDILLYKLPLLSKKSSSDPDYLNTLYKCNISHLTYIEVLNEDEEANEISELILNKLNKNPNEIITIVTSNIDLSNRIVFNLKKNNILYDTSFGIELTRTINCNFFTLISSIDINNINFIDLLSLLKNPLCKFSEKLYYIELIDLHLSRRVTTSTHLNEYLDILNLLLKQNILDDNEYSNIKNILTSLIKIFQNFTNNNHSLKFSQTLKLHIEIAESLSSKTSSLQFNIWNNSSGKTLKEALKNIIHEVTYLPEVTLCEYNNILLYLLKQYNVRQSIHKDTKVYICGILQAQYLYKSSSIIIADLNEKSFPTTPKREISYINFLLQKLNLPTKYSNIGKEALIFNKLCYFSKVYLTRSIKKQNIISTPSRFLTKLLNTLQINNLKLNKVYPTHNYSTLNVNLKNNSVNYINTKTPTANPPIELRPKTITATTIEKLLKNPYIYFIENVLKLSILPEINIKFTGKNVGILIHEILNDFFNQSQSTLKALDITLIHNQLLTIAKNKFNPYSNKFLNALLSYHIFEYFSKDISISIYNLIKNSTHINSELLGELQITNCNNLVVKGRADCISFKNNNATIIDFKTGSIKITKEELKTYRKQLIILGYILINKGFINKNYHINNLEYWIIPNNLSDCFKKIYIDKLPEESLDTLIETEYLKINKTIFKYLNTKEPFTYNLKYKDSLKEYIHFSRINFNNF